MIPSGSTKQPRYRSTVYDTAFGLKDDQSTEQDVPIPSTVYDDQLPNGAMLKTGE